MSKFVKQLFRFTDGTESSVPFTMYVEADKRITEATVVRVSEEEQVNPNTGELMQVIKVSGQGVIASHDPVWFAQLQEWVVDGKAVLIPFEEEPVTGVLARIKAARAK
jgi:hypothetical protein